MKLLEVVRGEKTAKDVLATVMDLSKKRRRRPWCPACATGSSAIA